MAKPITTNQSLSLLGPSQKSPTDFAAQSVSGNAVLTTIAVVAAMYFARDVFLPLAIAMLISFALSPLVTRLRNSGLPLIVSVLLVVTLAFAVIGVFSLLVVGQVSQLAVELPTFQDNIVAKLERLQAAGSQDGLVARLTLMVTEINAEITTALPQNPATGVTGGPIAVEVIEKTGTFQTFLDVLLPLVSPIAKTGLVIVVVVFMLVERDALRDRFIRLVGANDISRTTQVIEDAGRRVGTYLLIQLFLNIIYAIPIGVGLWVIGVPNALLWGMLTLVLRFVPYIGPLLSAVFPLFLAFAVSPDWTTVIWTAVLFGVVEMLSSNVVEPWLYGSRTGVSPLAIIVAAVFWTWLWGPMGLVLSTPLTVCLVVVGRYVPQFQVFDVIFGDQPVLAAHSRLYQRLLAGDTIESTLRAEEALEDGVVADFLQDVGIPALLLAQADYERGALSKDQENRFTETADYVLNELDAVVAKELANAGEALVPVDAPIKGETGVGPKGVTHHLVVLGGRTKLDDVAARMLAQSAAAEGAKVSIRSYIDLTPSRLAGVLDLGAGCIILNFLDPAPSRASLLHIPRLKRAVPHIRVGLVLWQSDVDLQNGLNPRRVSPDKVAEIIAMGADFCALTLDDALIQAFSDVASRPLVVALAKPRRRAERSA